ncbi:GNAT family N-acetyltransferase [Devosia nitrariae]|uniref:Acetyltransferase n=1 Tax=Devosia nitrariae TaxID=2071872 RepID=A0ABQ5W8D6_9HYPH|nr:GNAT family N-acetyltransferase [Devosia nitrariae]GLQ56089.1 acetyltransferase [Devosia nitrariae]
MEAQVYHPAHAPKPPFETERLMMRPYVVEDAEIVHAKLDTDPEVWRFDPGRERSLDERREVIMRFAMLHRQFGFGPCGAWGRDGTFIGQGGLNPYLYDHRDGTRTVEFEVMYKVARPFWRQGYATEIARYWVDYAFAHMRLPRLFIAPARANAGSVAVLRALGASFEDDWLDENAVIASLYPPGKTAN